MRLPPPPVLFVKLLYITLWILYEFIARVCAHTVRQVVDIDETWFTKGIQNAVKKGIKNHPQGWLKIKWSRGLDLNQRPPGYEPGELPNCSTPHCMIRTLKLLRFPCARYKYTFFYRTCQHLLKYNTLHHITPTFHVYTMHVQDIHSLRYCNAYRHIYVLPYSYRELLMIFIRMRAR